MTFQDSLKREYYKLAPIMTLGIASLFILLAIVKDIYLVGFRFDWFLIRLGFIPTVYLSLLLCRKSKFFDKHYELSTWTAAIYVAAYATYFSFYTGFMHSTYSLAIVSAIGGISIIPLSRFSFYGITLSCSLIFLSLNIWVSHPSLQDSLATMMPYLPVIFFFAAIYELFLAKRRSEYEIRRKLAFHINQQDERLLKQNKALADSQTDIHVGRIAAQVAHDIQSPIGAILSNVDRLTLSEASLRIREAALRLKAISDKLLDSRSSYRSEEIVSVNVLKLLKQVISEKNVLHQISSKAIQIQLNTNLKEAHSFANPLDFIRALSNILQNSIEAIDVQGIITISVQDHTQCISIRVKDDGKGVPSEIISKIFERGFSYGKPSGNGLGLSHAKEVIEAWGGRVEIKSSQPKGTVVEIYLRKPIVDENQKLTSIEYVLVDDNPLTHASWQGSAEKYKVKLLTFLHPTKFVEKLDSLSKETKIYIDYKFAEGTNGLELAEKTKLKGFEKVHLCTGMRNEELKKTTVPIVSKEPPWLAQKYWGIHATP